MSFVLLKAFPNLCYGQNPFGAIISGTAWWLNLMRWLLSSFFAHVLPGGLFSTPFCSVLCGEDQTPTVCVIWTSLGPGFHLTFTWRVPARRSESEKAEVGYLLSWPSQTICSLAAASFSSLNPYFLLSFSSSVARALERVQEQLLTDCSKMYQWLVVSRYGRHVDMEMTFMKEQV